MRNLLIAAVAGFCLMGCALAIHTPRPHLELRSKSYAQPLDVMARTTALAMYSLGWVIDREQSRLPYAVEAMALPSGWVQVTIGKGDHGQAAVRILSHIPGESARQLFEMIDKILERRGAITEI
jgi:hypothetical protein